MENHDYEKLFQLFSQNNEGNPAKLEEMLNESVALFDKLKDVFQHGTQSDKEAMLETINDIYSKLATETKKICSKSGMSEEDLLKFCENPNNFTPEQWNILQDTRQKLFESGKEINRYSKQTTTNSTKDHDKKDSDKNTSSKVHKLKNQKWMRS